MTNTQSLQHLINSHQGFLAAHVQPVAGAAMESTQVIEAGQEDLFPTLKAVVRLSEISAAKELRVVMAGTTMNASKMEDGTIVVVAYTTGAPVAKSIHRLVRRHIMGGTKRGLKMGIVPSSALSPKDLRPRSYGDFVK